MWKRPNYLSDVPRVADLDPRPRIAMTQHQTFTLFDPLAQQQIAESAAELLDGLWAAYTAATQAFLANPTEGRWRDRVRAHAAYAVAHRAETGTVEGVSDADG